MCSVGISSVSTKETESKLKKQGSITISDENYDYMLRTGEAVYLGDGTWAKIESPDEIEENISESRGLFVDGKDKMLTSNRDASASYTAWYHYVHFYRTINVSAFYTPELDIYVKCTGSERDFVQDADTIYRVINGDWYDYTYESGYVTNRP